MTCQECGVPMTGPCDKKFCSDACGQRAYRKRKEFVGPRQPSQCVRQISEAVSARMTDEELDELIAEQYPTMPENRPDVVVHWTVPVVRMSRRHNGRVI